VDVLFVVKSYTLKTHVSSPIMHCEAIGERKDLPNISSLGHRLGNCMR